MYLDINWDDIYASCSNMSHFYWGQVSLRRLQNHVQPSSGMIRVSENSTQETARNSFIPNKKLRTLHSSVDGNYDHWTGFEHSPYV